MSWFTCKQKQYLYISGTVYHQLNLHCSNTLRDKTCHACPWSFPRATHVILRQYVNTREYKGMHRQPTLTCSAWKGCSTRSMALLSNSTNGTRPPARDPPLLLRRPVSLLLLPPLPLPAPLLLSSSSVAPLVPTPPESSPSSAIWPDSCSPDSLSTTVSSNGSGNGFLDFFVVVVDFICWFVNEADRGKRWRAKLLSVFH